LASSGHSPCSAIPRSSRLTPPKIVLVVVLAGTLAAASSADAYSVLTHEANVDAAWDAAIKPLLIQRYPRAGADGLLSARAFAYGGSVIQDLGYYPFGSRFFSNLVHYVRSGDFVEALLRDARNIDEYAFALGALAHYAADTTGHPVAVNRSVALMFPKLAAKFGPEVTYAQSRATHVMVEFSFDVVQVAAGAYLPESYHNFVGFKVATPVLERAFHDTYGIQLRDIFADLDFAIGTYRHAISEVIPQVTEIAWRDKQDQITAVTPGIQRERFVFHLSRPEYERDFGSAYRKPGFLARLVVFMYRLLPKIGPLRPLQFKAPTPEAERLFLDSFKQTQDRYRRALATLRAGRLDLANTDFDTGERARHGEYELADETYATLLEKIAARNPRDLPKGLLADLNHFYGPPARLTADNRKEQHRLPTIRRQLAALNAPPKP
jgi:hypothetical protein